MSSKPVNNLDELDPSTLGIAGNTARFFINSPLSPLIYIAMFLMGVMGYLLIPRQEDPQISVPMIDLMVPYPGASAEQVAIRAIEPLQRIMSEIPGVKHVYSVSQRGMGVVTVQFDVGEKMNDSLVKVNDKIDSNLDKVPSGVGVPMVQPVGIDDVPVVTLTLWSKDLNGDGRPDVDDSQLRMLAHDLLQKLNEVSNTSKGFIVGGRKEVVKIEVLPEVLAGYGISLDQIAQEVQAANQEIQAGSVESGGTQFSVVTGRFLDNAKSIGDLIIGSFGGTPVHLRDVATISLEPESARQLVSFYSGPSAPEDIGKLNGTPAVTIAIAKKEGANGVTVAEALLERAESMRERIIPSNVDFFVTRNYGQTAKDKVNELIVKLFKATGFVFILVLLAFRAFKPAIVVTLIIPVVLLMTIFVAWIAGYTIDRVSLFALIFSIGILVDDAIVVIENIYRRWLEKGETDMATAVDAVREVGNPTILATFTVIGALMPMGFVSGMMGPYMEPIPALGSVAMGISLFAAFVFTPWLAISNTLRPSMAYLEAAEKREHKEAEALEGVFRSILVPMIENPAKRKLFNAILWGLLIFSCAFFYFKWVVVKMLPLDNKPEFSIVVDMPEGTALPDTANLIARMAEKVRDVPEVTAIQTYVGTSRPFDFNGMVRHYYLRNQPWQGDIQVQLLDKNDRKRTSHQIATAVRTEVMQIAAGTGASVSVVEMPPGPPVMQSVVAEVHGPTANVRREVARHLTDNFAQAENLTDVDNYLRQPYYYWRFETDREKASRMGVTQDTINRNIAMALGSQPLGDIKQAAGHEPTNIVLQMPFAERAQVSRLGDLPIPTNRGDVVLLRELGHFIREIEDELIYHKDLRPVEYVVADVAGRLAAPVYGMLQVQDLLAKDNNGQGYITPDGVRLVDNAHWMGPPKSDAESAFEWAGEWTVTYETFRDMGAAFVVALAFIYFLVVWEFGNFRIPALIMAPIPLTLLGIIPAHAIAGAEFTATSMIGWIALAGIIVRNSILLVDFTIHLVQQGMPLQEAVITACKTRTRPILITALALVMGASVILSDPIFQGMAISLAAGVLVSTILTLIVIPLGIHKARESLYLVAGVPMPAEDLTPPSSTSGGTGGSGNASSGVLGSGFNKQALTNSFFKLWGMLMTLVLAIVSFVGILINWAKLLLPKKGGAPKPPPGPTSPPPSTPPAAPPAGPTSPLPAPPAAPSAGSAAAVATAGVTASATDSISAPINRTAVVERHHERPAAQDAAVIQTSQASQSDIDLLSAPIRSGQQAAGGEQGSVPEHQLPRRRRGIQLRNLDDEMDENAK